MKFAALVMTMCFCSSLLAVQIPLIKKHYCLKHPSLSDKELIRYSARSLQQFKEYKNFDDGFLKQYKGLGYQTPLDMVYSIPVETVTFIDSEYEPDLNVLTHGRFAIQPMPKYDVAKEGYAFLQLDCLNTFTGEDGEDVLVYDCKLNKDWESKSGLTNMGLNKFDTYMTFNTGSASCADGVELKVVGDIEVNDADFEQMKRSIVNALPGVLMAILKMDGKGGTSFLNLFFNVDDFFTDYYNAFYGGWLRHSKIAATKLP
ncbi:MAG: hypothetical protein HOE90_24215 [Bacteriovoracaceae bacterium]|jgi:hypothetical protein|nr:hypothetical protein [Bacteriovoracaceae bacterium]